MKNLRHSLKLRIVFRVADARDQMNMHARLEKTPDTDLSKLAAEWEAAGLLPPSLASGARQRAWRIAHGQDPNTRRGRPKALTRIL